MDRVEGNILIGRNIRGTMHNGTSLVPGHQGNAVQFDGIDDYVDLGNHSDSCFGDIRLCTDGFTVSMWIKHGIVNTGETYFASGYPVGIWHKQTPNGQFKITARSSSFEWKSLFPAEVDRWMFVSATWHPSGVLTSYVDGCNFYTATPKLIVKKFKAGNPTLSARSDGQKFSNALIGSFAFWERNLTSDLMQMLYFL